LNPNGIIYGIDFSTQAVKESIKLNKANVASGRVFVKEASVSNIPYDDQFFDAITAFQTHYFWPSLEQDVEESHLFIFIPSILCILYLIAVMQSHPLLDFSVT